MAASDDLRRQLSQVDADIVALERQAAGMTDENELTELGARVSGLQLRSKGLWGELNQALAQEAEWEAERQRAATAAQRAADCFAVRNRAEQLRARWGAWNASIVSAETALFAIWDDLADIQRQRKDIDAQAAVLGISVTTGAEENERMKVIQKGRSPVRHWPSFLKGIPS